MRSTLPDKLNAGRLRIGPYGSSDRYGPYGVFELHGPCGERLRIMSSGGDDNGWEHVSVSTRRRTPNWIEMSFVKDLFWDDEESVMQLHPPRSRYVNNHPYCLHLWRPKHEPIPLPPDSLVGDKDLGVLGNPKRVDR